MRSTGRKPLKERRIHVGAPRTEEYVASDIAVCELARRRESRLIEPVVDILAAGEIPAVDPIRTAGGAGVDGGVSQLGREEN